MNCGYETGAISKNCAVTKAVNHLWPDAMVDGFNIGFFIDGKYNNILLPGIAKRFINKWDKLSPKERLEIEPFCFDIDISKNQLPQLVELEQFHLN